MDRRHVLTELMRLCASPQTDDSLVATRLNTFLPRSSSLSYSGFTSAGRLAASAPAFTGTVAASAGVPADGVFAQATIDQQPSAANPSAAARTISSRGLAGRIGRLGIETLRV